MAAMVSSKYRCGLKLGVREQTMSVLPASAGTAAPSPPDAADGRKERSPVNSSETSLAESVATRQVSDSGAKIRSALLNRAADRNRLRTGEATTAK